MEQNSTINSQQELIASLEELMVKEFRTLQSLVNIARDERGILTKGDTEALMPIVEEKENLLDQLGVLEDSRHMVIEEIAQKFELDPGNAKVVDILPKIDQNTAKRIDRLSEGILTLSDENRDLNLGNQALAATSLELMEAVKSFILSFYEPPETYDSFGRKPTKESNTIIRDIDQKA